MIIRLKSILTSFAFLVSMVLISFLSCEEESEISIIKIDNPFPENTMFPNVFEAGGEVVISFIHSQGDTLDQLYFSSFDGNTFSNPIKIAEGSDWFVNWADIPGIAKSGDNMIASWLEKSAEGTYDYDIKMKISNDSGKTWGENFIPHKDGVSAEHGFVSFSINDHGSFQAVWLDGRNTKILGENGNEAYGQMTLRSAIIHPDGQMSHELEIDEKVCDCCQTAIMSNRKTTMAVYRDRSDDEIRDNYFSSFDGKNWSDPKVIHNDGWKIAGCPVNGPVIASNDKDIYSAWYTEGNGKPEIYLARYNESRVEFDSPVLISDYGVMGRLDLEYLLDGRLLVTWLEDEVDNRALIKGKIYDKDLSEIVEIEIGETMAARSSGFPKIMNSDDKVLIIYQNKGNQLVSKLLDVGS